MVRRHSISGARRFGTTLVELLFVLMLLGTLLALAYPAMSGGLDRLAVRSARDVLAAGVARTRAVAVARGGAALVVHARGARFWIVAAGGDTVGVPVDLARQYGVRIESPGGGDTLALSFDGRGLGQVANRTIRVRRGGAEVGLTLSTYGRVRRW